MDRLLDYVRERRPAFESVDLRQIVSEAVALVTACRHARRKADHDSRRRLCRYASERIRVMLRQVVVNLLSNALDALDGPGPVQVDMGLKAHGTESGRVAAHDPRHGTRHRRGRPAQGVRSVLHDQGGR